MANEPVDSGQYYPTHRQPVLARGLVPLFFLLLLLAAGCSSREVRFADGPRQGPIVILGDSIAAAKGIDESLGFVALLEKRLGVEITNLGKSGITSAESLPRVKAEVLPLKPALVIVELGGNDALQKVDVAQTRQNLASIIEQVQAEKIPVVLLGMRGGVFSDKYAAMFEGLAEEYQTAFLPDLLDGVLTNPSLKLDTVHPNAKGHVMLADRVEPVLRPLLETMKLGKN